MALFLKLAVRNIFRHRTRTFATLIAIAIGCTALIVNGGIVFNIFRELRDDAIYGRHGHLQIYRRGYSARHLQDPEHYLISPEEVTRIQALVRTNPRVAQVTCRREFSGLISTENKYVPLMIVAVEPDDDATFSRHTVLRQGAPLSSKDPYGALAGLGLANKVNKTVGEDLELMTIKESGILSADQFHLRGVFEGGLKDYDDWTLKIPLPTAKQVFQDNRSEKIVLLLKRTEDVPQVLEELQSVFRKQGLDVEIRSWDELSLFHNQVVSLFGRELGAIRLIIATIVILGIGNAFGISIIERSVELATLRALGLRVHAIASLLIAEAVLVGLTGAGLGVALGVASARIITAIGISYPAPPGSTRPFLGGVDIVSSVIISSAIISVSATIAAAVFPIWRTLSRPVVVALRRN